ncbi:MAG: hypothetical protein L3K09_07545 [Thermoplasmata archaeon]|nr:hypothetical protein [Thermoplasmata archaeon]
MESPPVPAPAVAAVAPAALGGEEDIDSLMAELDKISGDILKRGPPKKPEDKEGSESGDRS